MTENFKRTRRSPRLTPSLFAVMASAVALATGGQADNTADRRGAVSVYSLIPSTHGNPEGIAYDPSTQSFFVGATGDGTIYRGTLGNSTVGEFIPGAPGKQAAGMKVFQGKLYVAGAFTGTVTVYDIATRQVVALFQNFAAGMLNDLVVTQNGDVFVTDSLVPVLWLIKAAQVASGVGVMTGIPVDPEIAYIYDPDPFNLNGIVALNGGRSLIVVQSNNGKLFRIDLDKDAPFGRRIYPVDVEPLIGGDGLLLDGRDLIVVQGGPPEMLTFVHLNPAANRGTVIERRSDPSFRFPTTVARGRGFYLLVNADFINNVTPFTVTGLPRGYGDDDQ
jgi:sugar lactone lactonase YvrE